MTLHKLTVLCAVVFSLQPAESQELLPAPSIEFAVSVNQSAIKLYSAVNIVCTLPNGARTPAEVHLSQADALNSSSPIVSFTLKSQGAVVFTVIATPERETAFVCWYRDIRTSARSLFSSSISIVISALFDPIIVLDPPLFAVGANYSVHIYSPQEDYTNTTLSLYMRLASNKSFELYGSRVLGPGERGGMVNIRNAIDTYEFLCEMEVFFNSRTLRSRSKAITAMPEKLPVRLVSKYSGSEACYGDASVKMKGYWRSICFSSQDSSGSLVVGVICRELGCGHAISFDTFDYRSYDILGTNCTGSEKKVAECPLISPNLCDKETFNIICSEALPPPKLSVVDYDAASRVYIRSEVNVELRCAFHSRRQDYFYVTFTHNGNDIYSSTRRALPGSGNVWTLRHPVQEGEYSCYIRPSSKYSSTVKSNVIGIYIYDPPPPGAIAAGVITTVLGVTIIVLLCVRGGC